MKKMDFAIIAVIALTAAAILLYGAFSRAADNSALTARIYVDGELWQSHALSGEVRIVEIQTPYGTNTLLIAPEYAQITSADCPSQDCVRTPKQSHAGGVIACLPHRVLIRLEGKPAEGGIDALAS